MASTTCEPPEDVDQDLTDSAVYVLIELHEFIKNVFRNLPMKTLHTCALVCRRWENLARMEKSRRQQPFWLLYENSRLNITSKIEQPITRAFIEPHIALAFFTSHLHDHKMRIPSCSAAVSIRHPRAAKYEKTDFLDYVKRLLPKSCTTMGVVTDGIVGSDGLDLYEKESSTAASVLFLPKMDKLHVHTFVISKSQMEMPMEDGSLMVSKDSLLNLLKVPKSQTPKIIMTFNADDMFDITLLEKAMFYHYGGKVIVAGGFTDMLFPDEMKDNGDAEDTLVTGIVFCGEDLQMASVVLDQSVTTLKSAEMTIQRLKQTNISTDWSLGFMFACIGRGHYHYHAENVETKAFRKHFPNIPLFGFFGNGEVGHNYLPDYSKADHSDYSVLNSDNGDPVYPKVRHSYSTVFVLMSRPDRQLYCPPKSTSKPQNSK